MKQKFNLYSTSSCPLFRDYIDTGRRKWEEDKEFSVEQVRAMALKNYSNQITSVMWSTKDCKDAQTLVIVVVTHKLMDEFNKTSENSTWESTKVESS